MPVDPIDESPSDSSRLLGAMHPTGHHSDSSQARFVGELGSLAALPLRLRLRHGQSIWIRVVMRTMFVTSFMMLRRILLIVV